MAIHHIKMGVQSRLVENIASTPTSHYTRQVMAAVCQKLEEGNRAIESNEVKSWAKAQSKRMN